VTDLLAFHLEKAVKMMTAVSSINSNAVIRLKPIQRPNVPPRFENRLALAIVGCSV